MAKTKPRKSKAARRKTRQVKVRLASAAARLRRTVAIWASAITIALHLILIGVLAARPMSGPIRLPVFRHIWMWKNERVIYLLVFVLLGSVGLTVIGLMVQGWHRVWLLATWILFLFLCATEFREPITAMMEVVFEQL